MPGSRLIVKNLPTSATSEKLRKCFSSKGEVTDVQLKFTKEGKFRHFAFVGFKTEDEAEAARGYFNHTFMGATKISVDVCADLGDASKPRAWSKYAQDSSAFREAKHAKSSEEVEVEKKELKKEEQSKVDRLLEKHKNDPKFQEFLRIHKRKAVGSWNNDAILEMGRSYEEEHKGKEAAESSSEEEEDKEEEQKVAFDSKVSDLDYLKSLSTGDVRQNNNKEKKKKEPKNEDYFTVKLSGLPYKAKKKEVKKFLQPLKAKSIRVPRQIRSIAYAGFATEKEMKKALNKNKSFMGSNQIYVSKYQKGRRDQVLKGQEEEWKRQEDSFKDQETIVESGRLFVRNLPYSVTEEEMEELFRPFGPLTEVNVPIDKNTRKVKGFALVTYVIPENAVKAYSALDGTTFQGRLLHVMPGKAKLSEAEEELAEQSSGLSSYKKQKAAQDKAKAQSSHNWNTLFLGSSAVADLMADRYGVEKKDVLADHVAGTGQSAAVRLALGETQIVAETRQFLEEQGVSLDAFGKPPTKRSKSVLVVKNLPANTSPEEIRDKFVAFGELGRVVLPPNGITAIVEFYQPTEARASFKKLAYSKFKGTPLYLEWAPEEAFKTKLEAKEPRQSPPVEVEEETEQGQSPPEEDTTLFVKNLSFETNDQELKTHFSSVGRVFSATVATKKNPKQVGATLSMGYGFVQFYSKSDASSALKTLQHKQLNGHSLELKRSSRAGPAGSEAKKGAKMQPTTKMVVRNVPFEANHREIQDLFKTFGQLKGVRLPKKVTGSHRGFAFVDFHTIQEAKKAFEALCHSTHLYGRRLVLEWAEAEETVSDLRKKTAQSYSGGPPSKRLKKSDIAESLATGGTDSA